MILSVAGAMAFKNLSPPTYDFFRCPADGSKDASAVVEAVGKLLLVVAPTVPGDRARVDRAFAFVQLPCDGEGSGRRLPAAPHLIPKDPPMRIHDTTLEAFRAKVLETGAPVRVIRTTRPGYRVVGDQVLDELSVVVQYLADVPAEGGEPEMWTAVESRPVDPRGEFDLAGALYETLPKVSFVKRTGTF